jgi:hypothetical protein
MAPKRRDARRPRPKKKPGPIPAGTDPRDHFRRHRERGPGQFRFTFADVADAADQALDTTRTRLRLDDDVRDVALYVGRALAQRSRKLKPREIASALKREARNWRLRWPRFDLYWCGVPSCKTLALEPGLCATHGGPRFPAVSIQDGYFVLRVGNRYEPFHRFVVGTRQVRHLDGNLWNNRAENLEPVRSPTFKRLQWSYGYRELAELFVVSEDGVRQAVARKVLDPASLESICCFWAGGVEVVSRPDEESPDRK